MPSISLPAAIAAAAVVGGGATLLASNHAANVSKQATDQSIALQQQQYAQTRQDEQPYVQAGYAATNALTSRLGLNTGTAPTGVAGSAGTAVAQPDYSQYLAANPDIAAEAQKVVGSGQFPSVGAYLQWHDANYGTENRGSYANQGPVNALTGSPATGSNGLTGAQTSPAVPDTGTGANPTGATVGGPGVYGNGNPNFTDPGSYQAPTYTPTAQFTPGTYTEPKAFSFTADDYKASPGYAYQVDQALKGALANSSATGALQSGATLKALEDRASNLANQDFYNQRNFAYGNYTDQRNFDRGVYTNDRDFGQGAYQYQNNFNLGQFQDQRNFGAGQFNTDRAFNYGAATDTRNYLTGQYNVGTGNLFQLANLGQGAASGVAAAGQNSTNGVVNALNGNAATQANAGIAGAGALNSFLGSGVNALAYSQGKAGALGGKTPTYSATSYPGLDY